LKKECSTTCDRLEDYLKTNSSHKTTYRNKEIGLSIVSMDKKDFTEWQRNERISSENQVEKKHAQWMLLWKIMSNDLTSKQKIAIWHYLENGSMAETGRKMGVSAQTVHSTIFGHPRHGGGAVRKIKKVLNLFAKSETT